MGYTKPSYITVPFGTGTLTPWVVSTTYFFGKISTSPVVNSLKSNTYMPVKGVIRSIVLMMITNTTAGSAEAWPMVFRLNDTTDTTIDTQSTSANLRVWTNYTLNIPVSIGDFFEIKTVTPAWATPPSGGAMGGGQGLVVVEVA